MCLARTSKALGNGPGTSGYGDLTEAATLRGEIRVFSGEATAVSGLKDETRPPVKSHWRRGKRSLSWERKPYYSPGVQIGIQCYRVRAEDALVFLAMCLV